LWARPLCFSCLVALHPERPGPACAQVEAIQEAFAPYVRDRGLDWESHIEYIDRSSWRENGLRPPMPDTDAEKKWIELNKPVPY
jgi:hypothetical protein